MLSAWLRNLGSTALVVALLTAPGVAHARGGAKGRVLRVLRKIERLPGRAGVLLLRPLTRRAMLRAHLDSVDRASVDRASSEMTRKTPSKIQRHPLLARISAEFRGLLPGTLGKLTTRVRALEAKLGGAVEVPKAIRADDRAALLYRAERAAALTTYGRGRHELSASMFELAPITLEGVGPKGRDIALSARRIYQEVWSATANSKTPKARARVLILPGYQETGRSYYELANTLNKVGCDVALADQQWGGHTTSPNGMPGQIDSGFGVARDAAALIAINQSIAAANGQPLIVLSSSMGAGRGATVAAMLMDQGKLDGAKLFADAKLNKRIAAAPRSRGFTSKQLNPFVESTPSWSNTLVGVLGKVPVVRELAFHSINVPPLNHSDAKSQADIAATGVRADAYLQPSAMARSRDVLPFMKASAKKGYPHGRTTVLTLSGDTLAHSKATQQLFSTVPGTTVEVQPGKDHSIQHSVKHINAVRDAIVTEIRRLRGPRI